MLRIEPRGRISTPTGFDLPSLAVGLPLSPSWRPKPPFGVLDSLAWGLAPHAGAGGRPTAFGLPAPGLEAGGVPTASRVRCALRVARVLAALRAAPATLRPLTRFPLEQPLKVLAYRIHIMYHICIDTAKAGFDTGELRWHDGITYEQVAQAADALVGLGQQPTIRAVREKLGDTVAPTPSRRCSPSGGRPGRWQLLPRPNCRRLC